MALPATPLSFFIRSRGSLIWPSLPHDGNTNGLSSTFGRAFSSSTACLDSGIDTGLVFLGFGRWTYASYSWPWSPLSEHASVIRRRVGARESGRCRRGGAGKRVEMETGVY